MTAGRPQPEPDARVARGQVAGRFLVAEASETLALCGALGLALRLAALVALATVLLVVPDDADLRPETAVATEVRDLARTGAPLAAPLAGTRGPATAAPPTAATAVTAAGLLDDAEHVVDRAADVAHGRRREAHPCREGGIARL